MLSVDVGQYVQKVLPASLGSIRCCEHRTLFGTAKLSLASSQVDLKICEPFWGDCPGYAVGVGLACAHLICTSWKVTGFGMEHETKDVACVTFYTFPVSLSI
jgi:hypothetical protein